MSARIAWFVMVHHKPDQFAWLWNAIADPDDLFLIHVDMKSRLGLKADRRGTMRAVRRILGHAGNIHHMHSRFTNWGGWSLSQVLLDAIAEALRQDPSWTHFVNVSGQCYPLQPITRIRQEMADSAEAVRVEMRRIEDLAADDWHRRWHPMVETPLRAIIMPGRRPPPTAFELDHKGSQWVVLPRAFCEWMVASQLVRSVRRYLRRLLLSDELVMQALAVNGPFRGEIADYRRYVVWPGPKVLEQADLPAMRASGAWFGRKFDVDRDAGVLETLAAQNGFRPGPGPAAKTG